MYKTGALLRPQHFSEFHKCRTNGVRKPRAAEAQGGPGFLQSQAAERWLTWDETHYSPSPPGRGAAALRCGQGATGVGHSEGHGPYAQC